LRYGLLRFSNARAHHHEQEKGHNERNDEHTRSLVTSNHNRQPLMSSIGGRKITFDDREFWSPEALAIEMPSQKFFRSVSP
jgi:hypothetical protein